MNFTEWKYLLLILVIFIAACIETDVYLPAFTDMMIYFSVDEESIQSLLTWNFIGMCLVGPLYGPVSDALGRRKPLLFGLGLFFLGSAMTLVAHNFTLMLMGRILQGLGSGGCFTLGIAIIFDTFRSDKASEALNKLNTLVPFIMAGAPMLGGYLNQEFGFKSNFLLIAVTVFASLLITFFFYKESHPEEKRTPFEIKKIAKDFKKVSTSLSFWQVCTVLSLIFAGYLTFLSGISVLYVLELGVSKAELPYFQCALLAAWLGGNLLFNRAAAFFGSTKVLRIGTVLTAIGGISLIPSVYFFPMDPYLPTAAMVLYSFGVNWINGVYFPESMELFPENKGTAASLLSSIRLLLTSAVVAFAGSLYNETIYPLAAVVIGVVCITLGTIICYERKQGKRSEIPTIEPAVELM